MEQDVVVESLDEAIKNVAKVVRLNIPTYGESLHRDVDDNINRMEKLLIIRAGYCAMMGYTHSEEVPETDEISEPAIQITPDTLADMDPAEAPTEGVVAHLEDFPEDSDVHSQAE